MNDATQTMDAYREQLRQCATALSVGKNELVQSFLPTGGTVSEVKMFTDGNLDKRFTKLRDHLEDFAEEFDDWEDLIADFVRTVPLTAYDSIITDSNRFLDWLGERCDLSAEQDDLVTCQQSRNAVELMARESRLPHVRFQELLSCADNYARELPHNADLWIHLNPIHVWSTFRTRLLLEDDDTVPASVLFFPVENDVRTAVVENEAEQVVCELESAGRCRLEDLAERCPLVGRDDLVELVCDLSSVGLIAFG